MFRFQKLRSRIIAFWVCLLLTLAVVGELVVMAAIRDNAKANLSAELAVGERVALRLLDQRRIQLE